MPDVPVMSPIARRVLVFRIEQIVPGRGRRRDDLRVVGDRRRGDFEGDVAVARAERGLVEIGIARELRGIDRLDQTFLVELCSEGIVDIGDVVGRLAAHRADGGGVLHRISSCTATLAPVAFSKGSMLQVLVSRRRCRRRSRPRGRRRGPTAPAWRRSKWRSGRRPVGTSSSGSPLCRAATARVRAAGASLGEFISSFKKDSFIISCLDRVQFAHKIGADLGPERVRR